MALHPLDYLRREVPRWWESLGHRLEPVVGPVGKLSARQRVAGSVLLVLLVTAAVSPVVCTSLEAAPTDAYMAFHCPACDHHFRLSHRDFEALWDAGEFRIVEGRELRCECPKCGEMIAERVVEPR